MQIGMIGLGRMGGNITRRLIQHGHQVVVYDHDPKAIADVSRDGATGAAGLDALVAKLPPPRAVWVMLPAGTITEDVIGQLGKLLAAGDIVLDGGNTFWRDDIRRAKMLKERSIHHVDVGTSGGVWGLERGYCMMIGGDQDIVERLDPIFAALAPGLGDVPRTQKRGGRDPRAEQGYIHAGPNGAGHFVKMVHNGIEYGLMQAYAEGFDILKNAAARPPGDGRFDLDLADIAEVWRRGSVVSSWLLDLTASALAGDDKLAAYEGFVEDSGEGRWTIMAAIEEAVPADVLSAALYTRFRSRQTHTFAEKILSAMRRGFGAHVEPKVEPTAESRRFAQGRTAMTITADTRTARPADPCSLVIFGASGDLTHRLLVPALYNLSAAGLLPDAFALIGVARSEMSSEAFRADLATSLPKYATRKVDDAVARKLLAGVAYVQGEPDDPASYQRIGRELDRIERERATGGNRLFYLATPPTVFAAIGGHLGESGLAREENGAWRRVIIEKPFGTDLALGAHAQSAAARRSQRGSDFPHRSLSGKGNRPEYFGAAVRQRPVRADLESRSYRPRPDHGRRGADRRPARQLLRRHRRVARHGAEPSVSAVVARRHGAAGALCRRPGARRQGGTARRGDAAKPRRGVPQFGARPIRRRRCRQ